MSIIHRVVEIFSLYSACILLFMLFSISSYSCTQISWIPIRDSHTRGRSPLLVILLYMSDARAQLQARRRTRWARRPARPRRWCRRRRRRTPWATRCRRRATTSRSPATTAPWATTPCTRTCRRRCSAAPDPQVIDSTDTVLNAHLCNEISQITRS